MTFVNVIAIMTGKSMMFVHHYNDVVKTLSSISLLFSPPWVTGSQFTQELHSSCLCEKSLLLVVLCHEPLGLHSHDTTSASTECMIICIKLHFSIIKNHISGVILV